MSSDPIFAGVDVGSATAKAVLLDDTGTITVVNNVLSID